MGYRFALTGALAVSGILALAAVGGVGTGTEPVGEGARAASAQASSAGSGRLERIARRKMNRFRASYGKAPLRYSPSLTRSAARQARYMLRNGYFGHLSVIRASRAFRSVAELILVHRGAPGQPRTAVRGWARSPAHRSIMLSGRYRSVGIGRASGRYRGRMVTFWVAHTGRR